MPGCAGIGAGLFAVGVCSGECDCADPGFFWPVAPIVVVFVEVGDKNGSGG